ncbi:MAG: DUF1566 domain-containing protein [Spirochaetes bacterium]|nr:MAG: DUF1566 domain-containing protein [Spirochaetota bacterium]
MKKSKIKIISISAALAAVLAITVIVLATGSGSNLPVTGQATEYSAGDDGSYKKGTDLPSIRFCDNGDGTVTDNMTGLMWVKNANAMGTIDTHKSFDSITDPDPYYNVCGPSYAGDGAVTWEKSKTFIAGLNSGTYPCGVTKTPRYTDWRMPTVNELETLINYSEQCGSLNAQGFDNVSCSKYYWCSPEATINFYSGTKAAAWNVGFANITISGRITPMNKAQECYSLVWPVRGPVTGN